MCVCYLQVYDSISAVALHRVELQVSLEVASIETRDGQTIAKPSLCAHTHKYINTVYIHTLQLLSYVNVML